MNTRSFVSGFALAAVLGVGGSLWLAKTVENQPIRYGPKTFYDDKDDRAEDTGYIVADGVITGDDMDVRTFLHVECRNETKTCRTNELSNLGGNRAVYLYNDEYPITSWGKDAVVAESKPPATACNHVKLVIVREAEMVQYNRIPQPNRDPKRCQALNNREYKWTLQDQVL